MLAKTRQTLARAARWQGIGIHTGAPVEMECLPTSRHDGIVFERRDLPGSPRIPAVLDHVSDTQRGTTLRSGEAEVRTVEHLMASLFVLGITDCRVSINQREVPIMDGSAGDFFTELEAAGSIQTGGMDSPALNLDRFCMAGDAEAYILGWPSPTFEIKYILDYPGTALGIRSASFDGDRQAFKDRVSRARTFCFKSEIEAIRKFGLAKGANLDNVLVLDEGRQEQTGMRFADEFAYHKILDFIGDLSLLGRPICGRFVAYRSGHKLNVALGKLLAAQK
jgi:UDP-3-O-[3-hydroxymyristoyl] N-acetylglucosamine deacetylase